MGSKSKSQITGYVYRMAVHMGLCRGPIDEIVEIQIDDITAWQGSITDDTDTFAINKPELFGGQKREGGIVGGLTVLMGKADQDMHVRRVAEAVTSYFQFGFAPVASTPGPHIGTLLGGLFSSFRGVTTVFYRGQISSNSPYPKPWRFRIRRALKGWQDDTCWYPEKAAMWLADSTIMAMNASHILYECLTNQAWGKGIGPAMLDEGAFVAAANVLCDEGMGLCLRWAREEPIDDFMGRVIEHIGAVLFVDRTTGLIVLRLIRDDYELADLPLFDAESGLLSVEADDQAASDQAYNEIVVTYVSPTDGKDRQVRAHNLASFQSTGTIQTRKAEYPGLPTASLALRVALRDLRSQAAGLKRYTLRLDRRGALLEPGGVMRLRDLSRGVADMVLRVGKIEESGGVESTIVVSAYQDVFGLPATAFQGYQETTWESPDRAALVVEPRRVMEASYRDALLAADPGITPSFTTTSAAVAVLAAQPSSMSMSYLIASRLATEEYEAREEAAFAPTATLAGPLSHYATAATFADLAGGGYITTGTSALIGDELVRIDAFDVSAGTLTLARGCGDTVPAAHATGTRIWFSEVGAATDGREYVSGETVDVKLLSKTSTEQLALDAAPVDTITLDQRLSRPYPPGDVRANATPVFSLSGTIAGDIAVTWTHRDRILQADQLIEHGASSIGPEAATTYTVRVFDATVQPALLLRTEPGIAGTAFTYDELMSVADGAATVLRFELESERDGLASLQFYSFDVARGGFGLAFNSAFNGGT